MTDDPEVAGEEMADEAPAEEPLHSSDGALDCISGRYDFIAFWLAKLGIDDPEGSALTFGEGCSLAILNPVTGEWLTPAQIAKKAMAGSVRSLSESKH